MKDKHNPDVADGLVIRFTLFDYEDIVSQIVGWATFIL